MKEEWKFYKKIEMKKGSRIIEVSNEGNVKLNGVLIDFSKRHPTRYHQVHGFYVHRMVAELFIPNPANKPFIDHINTNKLDNRAENLRWVTQTENMANPLTRKRMKEGWTDEVRKSHAISCKKYANEHPEWKEDISKRGKQYYSNPDNRKKHSERMKRAVQENEKWGGSYLKGCKYMINLNEFTKPILVNPNEFDDYFNKGYVFKNPKYKNYNI